MSSLNICQFIGNLGADPEIRSFQDGGKVANFRIACTESWRDKQTGDKRERTEWVSVSAFGEGIVRVIEQYLAKGSKVYVQGQFSTRKWQDKDGNDRYSTEVVLRPFNGKLVLLDKREGGSSGGGGQDQFGDQGSYNQDLDDEIPF